MNFQKKIKKKRNMQKTFMKKLKIKNIKVKKLSTENKELYGSVKPTEIRKNFCNEVEKIEIQSFR